MTHGKYLSECQVKPESHFVRGDAGQRVQERFANELQREGEQIRQTRKKQSYSVESVLEWPLWGKERKSLGFLQESNPE